MKIIMPKLGLTMTEGTLARWLKAEGDAVKQGEILFEFENDKALMEFESPEDGILAEILALEGETVPCGTPVARLEPSIIRRQSHDHHQSDQAEPTDESVGQSFDFTPDRSPSLSMSQSPHPSISATPAAKRLARELQIDLSTITGRGPQSRIQAADVEAAASLAVSQTAPAAPARRAITPVAKQLATELEMDWQQIAGSGPGGRVVKEDVLRLTMPQITAPPVSPVRVQPLTGVRAIIARRMSESAFTAPHVTLFTEADATALVEARHQLNAELGDRLKISYNTLFIALVARALQDQPQLNACIVDQEIHYYSEINIGLAVDTERGLLVPVIRQANQLDLVKIQQSSDVLIQRALAGKSLSDDLTGGTFTLTNLGLFDIDGFTPIINPPQAAILGVGRIAAKPVVAGSEVAIRQMVTLSLSFDHRVADGGPAARFLQRVKQLVERPFALAISNQLPVASER
jgi:pyruvate dehydrogenase E2 component (dihydrolipoamide acetyltransferase)